ncbi:hypothetical protein [Streptomyces mirabilis]|uniref:hypothetical protein n=1 Tax=Streptomyces mirabilis TaxID=68239 RepID=UPI003403AD24
MRLAVAQLGGQPVYRFDEPADRDVLFGAEVQAGRAGRHLGRCRDVGDRGGVAAAFASPAARAEAHLLEVRRLGVDAYPTLLLHTAHGTDCLGGGPIASADALTHALDQHGRHHGPPEVTPSAPCERKRPSCPP